MIFFENRAPACYSGKIVNVVARTIVVNLIVNLRHTHSCRMPIENLKI